MNILDKAIEKISPITAYKREYARAKLSFWREFRNSGYDQSGASKEKKALKGWNSLSRSPTEDINNNLDTLRQRSRSLYQSATLARSAINTNRTNIVGAGLRLKSKIDFKSLSITREQADEWEKNTEKEFALWAESKWCDTLRLNNFNELQGLALVSWLMNGDVFPVIKYSDPKNWMPYSLRLHLIEGDRVCTPGLSGYTTSFYHVQRNTSGTNPDNENPIYNGVEVDKKNGAVVAYWIANKHPKSITGVVTKYHRVEAYGEKTGNPNILHLMEPERAEQYRGVPYLAPVIEALKQVSRYTEAELTAAVIQAFFTAFIKYSSPDKTGFPVGEAFEEEELVDSADENSYELGAGTINVLGLNEDVVFGDPSRPSNGFEPFIKAMSKQIGAALEIPYELLTKAFEKSYSASRAALLEAWKAFKMRRTWFANDFCQPVYELWLSEAVARGRIKAPGFFNDPIIKKAWTKAQWIGPAPGQVDPVKEVTAAKMRVEEGFSTKEQETTQLTGGDWDDNIEQRIREEEMAQQIAGEGGNNETNNITNLVRQKVIERSVTESE